MEAVGIRWRHRRGLLACRGGRGGRKEGMKEGRREGGKKRGKCIS